MKKILLIVCALFFLNSHFSLSAEETLLDLSPEELQAKLSNMVFPYTGHLKDDDILAHVDNCKIFYSDIKHGFLNMLKHHLQMEKDKPLTDEIAEKYKNILMQKQVQKKVLENEISKLNLYPHMEKVEEEFLAVMKEFPEGKFQTFLKFEGLSAEGFKKNIRFQMGLNEYWKMVDSNIEKISDEMIKKAYEKNQDNFIAPAKIRFSHILIKNSDDAEAVKTKNLELIRQIREDIVNGKKPFEFYAKNFSDDAESRKQGGDSELILERDLKELFFPLKKLQEGSLSKIYSFEGGFYIAKVTKKIPEKLLKLDEVKDSIKEFLKNQQITKARQDQLNKILNNAKIEILKK